jgi:hypothetical protein
MTPEGYIDGCIAEMDQKPSQQRRAQAIAKVKRFTEELQRALGSAK